LVESKRKYLKLSNSALIPGGGPKSLKSPTELEGKIKSLFVYIDRLSIKAYLPTSPKDVRIIINGGNGISNSSPLLFVYRNFFSWDNLFLNRQNPLILLS
jgi:hypothetical protein